MRSHDIKHEIHIIAVFNMNVCDHSVYFLITYLIETNKPANAHKTIKERR